MDIRIFLEYNNVVVQFPVNPEKLKVKMAGNNKTTEVIKLGEVNLLKKRRLAEISWDCFFPYQSWFPAIVTRVDFRSADFYLDFINRIRDDCKPCRLIVTGIGLSVKVSIESFDYHHQAGDHEDTYYEITLKEYKDYTIGRIPVASPAQTNAAPVVNKVVTAAAAQLAPAEITIGCDVVLNGRVHYDSYGAKPGKTFSNYRGRVNLINKKGSHPYHVTTPSGGWLGWVTKESVKLV